MDILLVANPALHNPQLTILKTTPFFFLSSIWFARFDLLSTNIYRTNHTRNSKAFIIVRNNLTCELLHHKWLHVFEFLHTLSSRLQENIQTSFASMEMISSSAKLITSMQKQLLRFCLPTQNEVHHPPASPYTGCSTVLEALGLSYSQMSSMDMV